MSRRGFMQVAGASAAWFAVGCTNGTASVEGTAPQASAPRPVVADLSERHVLHRIAYLTGEPSGFQTCEIDCTARFRSHEYGDTTTWH